MSEEQIARQILEILQEFVARVLRRVPGASGGANYHGPTIHGERSPYASFLLNGGDHELCLMAFLRKTEDGLECAADLSAPNLLVEMPALPILGIEDPGRVAPVLEKVRAFAYAQEDRAVEQLRRDLGRSGPL
jgi:hypothetical protein